MTALLEYLSVLLKYLIFLQFSAVHQEKEFQCSDSEEGLAPPW